MNKDFFKKWMPTMTGLLCAICMTGAGAAIYLETQFGSDTITVLADGLHNLFNVSQGGGSRIYNLIFLGIALIVGRKYIGVTTLIYAFSVGFFIDFFSGILSPLQLATFSPIGKVGCLLIAQCLYGLSFALLIRYQKGMNQADAIAQGICDRTKLSFKVVRTIIDALTLLCGWLLGGIVGFGSIIAVVTTGTFITIFQGILNKLLGEK